MIAIYRGDDTGGAFGRKFTIQVNCGDGVSLAGCTGEFTFAGIKKTLKNLVNGVPAEISYSHNETLSMPYGPGVGVFAIYDAAGKRRTFDDSVRVVVTRDLKIAYPGASSYSVDAGSWLTPATADKLGGVKVGDGLAVAADGTLSVDVDAEDIGALPYSGDEDAVVTVQEIRATQSMGAPSVEGDAVVVTTSDFSGFKTSGLESLQETLDAKYEKPEDGIPAEDIADGVIPDIGGIVSELAEKVVAAEVTKYKATVSLSGAGATVLYLFSTEPNPAPNQIDITKSYVDGGYEATITLGTDSGKAAVIAQWKATASARVYNKFCVYGNGDAARTVGGVKTTATYSFSSYTEKDTSVAPKANALTSAGLDTTLSEEGKAADAKTVGTLLDVSYRGGEIALGDIVVKSVMADDNISTTTVDSDGITFWSQGGGSNDGGRIEASDIASGCTFTLPGESGTLVAVDENNNLPAAIAKNVVQAGITAGANVTVENTETGVKISASGGSDVPTRLKNDLNTEQLDGSGVVYDVVPAKCFVVTSTSSIFGVFTERVFTWRENVEGDTYEIWKDEDNTHKIWLMHASGGQNCGFQNISTSVNTITYGPTGKRPSKGDDLGTITAAGGAITAVYHTDDSAGVRTAKLLRGTLDGDFTDAQLTSLFANAASNANFVAAVESVFDNGETEAF